MAMQFDNLAPDEQEYLSMAVEHGGAFTVGAPSENDGSRHIVFGSLSRQFGGDDAERLLTAVNSLIEKELLVVKREAADLMDYEVTPAGYACFPDSE